MISSRKHIKFNISFPTKLMNTNELNYYISNIKSRSDYISDINITARIEPFIIDAHGLVIDEEFNRKFIDQMLKVENETGVPISLTLNNIFVPNDNYNLELFIKNLQPYYDMGIRNMTLPHIVWLDYDNLRISYPDIKIKITTIRQILTAQDFWNYGISGFDVINVDRRLLRNISELEKIREAQIKLKDLHDKRPLISIVCNEQCVGNCKYFAEHYQYTMTNSNALIQNGYNINRMPHYSCLDYKSYSMRRFYVMGLEDTVDKICENIDILKLGGRRPDDTTKNHAFDLIDNFYDEGVNYPKIVAPIMFRKKEKEMKVLKNWNSAIKECKFQCWNCNTCDELEQILSSYYDKI